MRKLYISEQEDLKETLSEKKNKTNKQGSEKCVWHATT